jgi:hypothetical protein
VKDTVANVRSLVASADIPCPSEAILLIFPILVIGSCVFVSTIIFIILYNLNVDGNININE